MEREQSEFCNLKASWCTEMAPNSAVKNTGREIQILYVHEPLKMSFKDLYSVYCMLNTCVWLCVLHIFFNILLFIIYYILYPLTVY